MIGPAFSVLLSIVIVTGSPLSELFVISKMIRSNITVEKKNDTCKNASLFVCTQLHNELSLKVPVAQVLKEIERSSNPEQPGLSCSIRYEVVSI